MSNKAITLLEFAQNKKIEIPIFQRDYAQGRNDETTDKIRKDFVNSLIETLDKNIPIELDFIYGREVDNTITLIDGQQRLTTLFLLHWYISQRIGKIDAFKKTLSLAMPLVIMLRTLPLNLLRGKNLK